MTDAVPLRYRIGGRWAISWPAFALLAVVSLLMSLQRLAAQSELFGSGLVLATGIAVTAAIGLAMALADRTVLRNRAVAPVSLPILVAVGVGIGLALAATNILAGRWTGLYAGSPDITIVRSVVIALIVAAVLATAKKEEAVSEIAVADLVTARKELGILLPVQSVRAKRT